MKENPMDMDVGSLTKLVNELEKLVNMVNNFLPRFCLLSRVLDDTGIMKN
jgi:hypothetical protein